MGRKRERGPKRRHRKTGGVEKGTAQASDEKRKAIVPLKRAGCSGSKIAKSLKLPRSTVQTVHRIISAHVLTGASERERGLGRPQYLLLLQFCWILELEVRG